MKKLLLILILLFSITIFAGNKINAQFCFDPDPNCIIIQEYTKLVAPPVNIGNGCYVAFSYTFRHLDCNGHEVCTFTFIPPSLTSSCSYYANRPQEFLEDIMKMILELEDYPCKPKILNECSEYVEFYLQSCWKWDGTPFSPDPNAPQPTLIPCTDESGCCRMTWQVCMISDDPLEYKATMTIKEEVAPCIDGENCDLILCP
jgi:hypothetical protein